MSEVHHLKIPITVKVGSETIVKDAEARTMDTKAYSEEVKRKGRKFSLYEQGRGT